MMSLTVRCLPLWVLLWIVFHAVCQSSLQEDSFGLVSWPTTLPPGVQERLENNVISLHVNHKAMAAIKVDGEVVTWGSTDWGGDSSAVKDQLLGNVTNIFSTQWGFYLDSGGAFAALKVGGEVVTWGSFSSGGDSSAVRDRLLGNVTTILCTEGAFASLKAGGEVVAWGDSDSGGDSSAVKDQLLGNVTTIFSIKKAFVAVKVGGEVVTWGNPDYVPSFAVKDQLLGNVTTIFSNAAQDAFAALKAGGEVATWGASNWGGDSSAVKHQLLGNVTTILSTNSAFAALKAGGEVVTWGDPSCYVDSFAVKDQLLGNVTTIFSNLVAFAALKAGGEVVTWQSSNLDGCSFAMKDQLLGNVTTIFSTDYAFAALKAGGEVVTWGWNDDGGDSFAAVKDQLLGNVTTIFSNLVAFAALKVGGEVVTWGSRDSGGDSSSVKDQLLGNVTTIFSTDYAFAALQAGGEVVTWGKFDHGGDSTAVQLSLQRRVSNIIPIKHFPSSIFVAFICIPRRPSGKDVDVESSCELCSPDQFWSGVIEQCQQCDHAQVPNFDQSLCETCRAGFIPDISNAVCTECSGNLFVEAGGTECKECDIGKVSHEDKSSCRSCASDQIAEDGSCKACPYLFKPNEAQNTCMIDFLDIFIKFSYVVLLSTLVKLLFTMFSNRYVVIDVSLQQGKAILTTLTNHNLSSLPGRPNFQIFLQGTCHPGLDFGNNSKAKVVKAKTPSSNTLELLDVDGNSINERFDTSSGTFSLTYADSCLHVSLMSIPSVLPATVIFVTLLLIAVYNLTAIEAGVMTLVSSLSSFTFVRFMKLRESQKKGPLQRKLHEFHGVLSTVNPNPTSCPKGPGRAISLGKLLEMHDFFRAFIRDRTAYYLDGNILKPLTAKHRLSYAELVGPDQVDFFVSHFWGTEFIHFCASLQKHAETFAMSQALPRCNEDAMLPMMTRCSLAQTLRQKQHVAYWICFCSNNQYAIHDELGGDVGWQESSFYLALQSPTCRCTCMVLDDQALPLTRSWCIFETLQALKLSNTRPCFDLLLCTASGVLNFGNGSIQAALGIVERVASMNLQDAKASHEADKVMINRLVIDEMGSFDELNNFIRKEIYIILEKAQKTCTSEFENLFHVLESAMNTAASANTSQNAKQSDGDEGRYELHQVYGRSLEAANVALQVDHHEKRAEVIRKYVELKKQAKELEEEMGDFGVIIV